MATYEPPPLLGVETGEVGQPGRPHSRPRFLRQFSAGTPRTLSFFRLARPSVAEVRIPLAPMSEASACDRAVFPTRPSKLDRKAHIVAQEIY